MKLFICLIVLLSSNLALIAQDYEYREKRKLRMNFIPRYPLEIGFHLGTTMFLGDLGGTDGVGRGFIIDTDFATIRPSIGLFARYSMGGNFSFRLEMSYLNFAGNDKFTGGGFFSGTQFSEKDGWFRFYRNLHFQTHVFELTNSAEFTPYNFKLTGSRYTKAKQAVYYSKVSY